MSYLSSRMVRYAESLYPRDPIVTGCMPFESLDAISTQRFSTLVVSDHARLRQKERYLTMALNQALTGGELRIPVHCEVPYNDDYRYKVVTEQITAIVTPRFETLVTMWPNKVTFKQWENGKKGPRCRRMHGRRATFRAGE
jgi:hypothetical protein